MARPSIKRRELSFPESTIFDDLPEIMARVLVARGIQSSEQIDHTLKNLFAPDLLKDLSSAVDYLSAAILESKKMLIIGDFDADGATSTALCLLALKKMGAAHVDYLVPNRFEYGYGLTPEIVEIAAQSLPDVIITVDNGISSLAGVERAAELNIDVIVTDHHLPGKELPAAIAIINPNQPACEFPCKNLAGVGVAFYFMSALRSKLVELDWFESQKITPPKMAQYLDLVALGTVADVVPLDFNNRIMIEQGLRRIRAGKCRPGITSLIKIGKRNQAAITSMDLGFVVGPRINSAGRLEDMSVGIECLISDSEQHAQELAEKLDKLNLERRSIEAGMVYEASAILDKLPMDENKLPVGVCLYDKRWHQGVIGILASRLKDKLNRPVIAFAPADNSTDLKGSGRSIAGFHMRDALDEIATANPGLIDKFGGHAMAAGLSLPKENLAGFKKAFAQLADKILTDDILSSVIESDGELQEKDMNLELAQQLSTLVPWGQNFPEPVFDGVFDLVSFRILTEKHLKMVLQMGDSNSVIDAIQFNADLGLWHKNVKKVRLAYRLSINEFRNVRTTQLMVSYLEILE